MTKQEKKEEKEEAMTRSLTEKGIHRSCWVRNTRSFRFGKTNGKKKAEASIRDGGNGGNCSGVIIRQPDQPNSGATLQDIPACSRGEA